MKFNAWTNRSLEMQKKSFNGAVVDISMDMSINRYRTRLCPPEMHAECIKRKGCQDLCPQSRMHMEALVGHDVRSFMNPGKLAIKRLDKIAKQGLQECRELFVLIVPEEK